MKFHFATVVFEASLCYFFENWGLKLKFPNLLKPLGTIIQQKYWSFYPSKPSTLDQFNMIHPVSSGNFNIGNLIQLYSIIWVFLFMQVFYAFIHLKKFQVSESSANASFYHVHTYLLLVKNHDMYEMGSLWGKQHWYWLCKGAFTNYVYKRKGVGGQKIDFL